MYVGNGDGVYGYTREEHPPLAVVFFLNSTIHAGSISSSVKGWHGFRPRSFWCYTLAVYSSRRITSRMKNDKGKHDWFTTTQILTTDHDDPRP